MDARTTHLLERLDACGEARDWAATQPDLRTAWERCERGDWLLWLAASLEVDRRVVVRAAVACARPVVERHTDGATQIAALLALHVAGEWCEGRADLDDVRAARDAAYAAYDAARAAAYAADAAYAAYDAARDAAYAAYAAYAAARAAAYAAYAAYAADAAYAAADAADAAYAAAYAAYAADALAESLRESADTVRSLIPYDLIAERVAAREAA